MPNSIQDNPISPVFHKFYQIAIWFFLTRYFINTNLLVAQRQDNQPSSSYLNCMILYQFHARYNQRVIQFSDTIIFNFVIILQNQRYSMQKRQRQYTPTRASKIFNSGTYVTPKQSFKPTGQLAIMRQYQHLKAQARQLQVQNRSLVTQVQKLKYQKNLQQTKLLQKSSLQQQTLNQFQKQKAYQMDLLKIKIQEDVSKLRRQLQLKVEEVQKQIRIREGITNDLLGKSSVIQNKSSELRNLLEQLQHDLFQYRNNNSKLTEQLTHEQFANKKLEMLAEELERQKIQMETQIHVLLDIEADKSRTIMNLEVQLQNSQNSQKQLHQKLAVLTQNFATLDQHVSTMKDRLFNADIRGEDLDKQLQNVQLLVADAQTSLAQQRQRQSRVRAEIEGHRQREVNRVEEIGKLIEDNSRLYRQSANVRHSLYNVSIEQGINI